jgi:hypothetical protein
MACALRRKPQNGINTSQVTDIAAEFTDLGRIVREICL